MRRIALVLVLLTACGATPETDSGSPVDASRDTGAQPDVQGTDAPAADALVGTDAAPVDASADAGRADVPPDGPRCIDMDGDRYGSGLGCVDSDCDDTRADVHRGAAEACDGIDQNCDGYNDSPEVPDPALNELNDYCRRTAPADAASLASPPRCTTSGTRGYTIRAPASCQACATPLGTASPAGCRCWRADDGVSFDCAAWP